MARKEKKITVRFFVDRGNGYEPWENLAEEEKKRIAVGLNDRALRAIGMVPVGKSKAREL